MTITVQSDQLAAALKHGVASARSPLPILQHARLHVRGSTLHVDTTDTDAWVSARLPVEANAGAFDIVLRDDLLRPVAAPGAGAITINAEGKIKSKRGRYTVPSMPADDFPQVDDINWQPLDVDAAALAGAIEAGGYAAAEIDLRPVFKAVQVVPGLVWSTDGYQVAAIALDYQGPRLSIPPKHVDRVVAALLQAGATVEIGNVGGGGAGMLRITGDALQLSVRLFQSQPMDMGAQLAKVAVGDGLNVPGADLSAAVRRFQPFVQHGMAAKQRLPEVEIRFAGGVLSLHDRQDQFSEVVSSDLEGAGDWSLVCDIKRLQSILGNLGTGGVVLHANAQFADRRTLALVPVGLTHQQAIHLLAPVVV